MHTAQMRQRCGPLTLARSVLADMTQRSRLPRLRGLDQQRHGRHSAWANGLSVSRPSFRAARPSSVDDGYGPDNPPQQGSAYLAPRLGGACLTRTGNHRRPGRQAKVLHPLPWKNAPLMASNRPITNIHFRTGRSMSARPAQSGLAPSGGYLLNSAADPSCRRLEVKLITSLNNGGECQYEGGLGRRAV